MASPRKNANSQNQTTPLEISSPKSRKAQQQIAPPQQSPRMENTIEQAAELIRISKSDPNVLVRPWVTLWKQSDRFAGISLQWEQQVGGRTVKASWEVTGDAKLGLPTPADRRLFNVLCELTREQDFPQIVRFTRYDLLKRLNKQPTNRAYDLLFQSFHRLKGTTIAARNTFRDARTGILKDVLFSILDDVEIVKVEKPGRRKQGEPPLSSFKWSDRIYENIRAGFLVSFDLNIANTLKSDVALILYPLLLVKTYDGAGKRRSHFHIELRELCENHLGMRSTPYVSKMAERLRPGHEELKAIGFLKDAVIEPMRREGCYKVTYTLHQKADVEKIVGRENSASEKQFGSAPSILPSDSSVPDLFAQSSAGQGNPAENNLPVPSLPVPSLPVGINGGKTASSETISGDVLKQMSEIGIEVEVAEKTLTQYAVEEIVQQLACLTDRKPRDPAALFLYALRRELPAPATYLERITQRQQQEMALATTQEARQHAFVTAQRIKETREIQRRQMGTTTAFYEGLSDRAKAIVRQRVDVELDQFGAQGRLLYPHPDWIQVLGSLLSDENWAASLSEWEDDWDEEATEAAMSQNSLFARLDLYIENLRSLLHSGEVDSQNLEQVREKSFPLLDSEEWETVKERALGDK